MKIKNITKFIDLTDPAKTGVIVSTVTTGILALSSVVAYLAGTLTGNQEVMSFFMTSGAFSLSFIDTVSKAREYFDSKNPDELDELVSQNLKGHIRR